MAFGQGKFRNHRFPSLSNIPIFFDERELNPPDTLMAFFRVKTLAFDTFNPIIVAHWVIVIVRKPIYSFY